SNDADGESDDEDGDDDADDGAAAIAANLQQLKEDSLEIFQRIHKLNDKMKQALLKHGHRSKEYVTLRDKIGEELMYIRFTARIIERLSDSVRSMVEQVRRHEREIQHLVVVKGGMPRSHFIKLFPNNETSQIGRASCREREYLHELRIPDNGKNEQA